MSVDGLFRTCDAALIVRFVLSDAIDGVCGVVFLLSREGEGAGLAFDLFRFDADADAGLCPRGVPGSGLSKGLSRPGLGSGLSAI